MSNNNTSTTGSTSDDKSSFSIFGGREERVEEEAPPRSKVVDQIRRDLIAAACLGPCKPLNRELLRIRTLPSVPMSQHEALEQQLWKCVSDFATSFAEREGDWGSAMIIAPPSAEQIAKQSASNNRTEIQGGNVGDIYYFQRATGNVQWERPETLDKLITKGKAARDQTDPIHDCEFVQINFLVCTNSTRSEKTGCTMERDKLMRCMRAKTFQGAQKK